MVLTLKYHPLAFILGLLTPVVTVNGQRIQARWGRNEIPMPSGQYQLHIHAPYLIPSRIGTADTIVPVAPGQIIDVEYRAPVWVFSAGSLGPPPQQYNGLGAQIGIMAGCFGITLLMIILLLVT